MGWGKRPRLIVAGILLLALGGAWYWPRFAGTHGAGAAASGAHLPYFEPDPAGWDAYLRLIVDGGLVDYDAAGTHRALLDAWLADVARATPGRFPDADHQLAFFINAYNAMVIDGVLRRMPMDSVADAGAFHYFFRERAYTVAGARVSLHGLETVVMRGFDPRLHFALNCASLSCPPLAAFAYRGEVLDAQLAARTALFLNQPAGVRYDRETHTLHVSRILEWYAEDFGGPEGVRALLRRVVASPIPEDAALVYMPYQWALNRVVR